MPHRDHTLPVSRFKVIGAPVPEMPRRTVLQTTYQLMGRLRQNGPHPVGPEDLLVKARLIALDWMKQRFPHSIPRSALEGLSFTEDSPGHRLEVVGVPTCQLWCARLEHPDIGLGDSVAPVAGRAWRTDISLAVEGKHVHFGVRINCSTRPEVFAELPLVRPRLIRDWSSAFDMVSALPIDGQAIPVAAQPELDQLKGLLENPLRQLPVVVLTNPTSRDRELVVSDWVLDPIKLAKKLLGWAHVVLLPDELTFPWSDLIGRAWGVYHGAVRIYRPGLEFQNQSPYSHPLFTLERILSLDSIEELVTKANGEARGFEARLESLVTAIAVARPRDFSHTPFVPEAQGIVADLERQRMLETAMAAMATTALPGEWKARFDLILDQAEAERSSHKKQVEELNQQVDEALAQAISFEEDRDRVRAEAVGMKWQITELTRAVQESGRQQAEVPIPEDYASLSGWVQWHLSGRLRLHPRAERAVKDAIYEDHELVYRALLLLGNAYQPMRLMQPGARERWEQGLAELELDFGGSIELARAYQEGEDYFVKWPIGSPSSQKRFLEFHLRKGSSHNPRFCLGIYFFWDDDEMEVVVGSLPAHLDNRLT